MKAVFIYALRDPRTGNLRYCGQTSDPDDRLSKHLNAARQEKNKFYNACWIRSLLALKLKPVMEILDVVPDCESDFWEREYIQNFRERNFDLTNFSDGGNAPMRGKKQSPETIAKRVAKAIGRIPWNKGQKTAPETLEKLSAIRKGKPSPNKGKIASLETRKKLRESHLGQPAWNKGVVGIDNPLTGSKRTLEQRSHISAGIRAANIRRKDTHA